MVERVIILACEPAETLLLSNRTNAKSLFFWFCLQFLWQVWPPQEVDCLADWEIMIVSYKMF